MKLNELIDNLIELSCEEMPEEAKQSLDDAIDRIVSSMTDEELSDILEHGILQDIELNFDEHESILMKSILNKAKNLFIFHCIVYHCIYHYFLINSVFISIIQIVPFSNSA